MHNVHAEEGSPRHWVIMNTISEIIFLLSYYLGVAITSRDTQTETLTQTKAINIFIFECV